MTALWKSLAGCAFLFALATATGARAQGNYPITMQVQLVPPYSAYASDYLDQALISFNNSGQAPLDIYLRGRFENDRGQFIETNPNAYSLVPIHVPGMQTVVVQGMQLDDGFLDLNHLTTNLTDEDYNNFKRLGMLPEGYYSFCIYAYKRTADGTYILVSDPQGPGACFFLNIGYVTPPVILAPAEADSIAPSPMQNVNISWTMPLGNLAGAMVAYDLYIVKVLPGSDPNVAMNNAVQYGSGLFIKQPNIQINNFQFTNLFGFNLEEGSQYALMVQANDLNNHTAFENNGKSATVSFIYGTGPGEGPGNDGPGGGAAGTPVVAQGTCSCAVDVAALDQSNHNSNVAAGGSFTMATVTVHVGSVTNNGTTISGDGSVKLHNVPVQVTFQNVIVNGDGVAIAGTATGKMENGFGFLNNGGTPSVSTADYNSFTDRLANYNLDAVAAGAGLKLPFGLHTLGAPDAVNVGIASLTVTPAQATYNAVAVVQLADANNVLSLAAKDVCFSDAALMCGDALFVLAADLEAPLIHLTFNHFLSAAEPGTFVRYTAGELQQFHINADYAFPTSLITKTDGSQAIAALDADAANWSDWTASVTIAPFQLPAMPDMDFTLTGAALYDHSTLHNPAGMPSSLGAGLEAKNAEIAPASWTGFFIPTVSVALPGIVASTANPDGKLLIGASNLVVDQYGLSGTVGALNVVAIGDGSVGGWYCSVDDIGIKLLNSSFIGGGMHGHLILPFSDKNNVQSRIGYSCTLSSMANGGGLTYQFITAQQNAVDFSAWWAQINLDNCAIQVTNNTTGGHTRASADLSGKLSLQHDIEGIALSIDLVTIEHLQVSTDQPYVQLGNATAGLSSPQHSMADFPISFTGVEPAISGSTVGLKFTLKLNLSDVSNSILPNASTTFSVKADVLGGARPVWQRLDLELNQVCVEGDLAGVMKIEHACIDFFKDDPVFGDGISGGLSATFSGFDGIHVECQAKFGNTSFNYWYTDASATISPPVAVATGVSINGFGGGAWYNMVPSGNVNLSASDYFKNMASYEMGAFRPQSNTLGFKVKLCVSSNDGYIYSGFGSVSMTFNTGTFSVNSIDGDIYVEMLKMTEGMSDDASAPVRGLIHWHAGIADKVYGIDGAVDVSFPVISPFIEGHGTFQLLADGKNSVYYIKLGSPLPYTDRVSLSLLDLVEFRAYFMAGNQIDAIPPPDPSIFDVSQLSNYRPVEFGPNDGGVMMGASVSVEKSLQFLCFYAEVSAGIGFDISLARYTTGCNGSHNLIGLNGWYAIGQVYAKLEGSLGMDVDVPFLPRCKVEAGAVGASLLLQGGLPSPYWFNGYAHMYFRALGIFSGSVNFHVSIGDMCVPEKKLFTLPLIAELKPTDQTTNVPVNASVEATFNFPVDKAFDIATVNNEGMSVARHFRLDLVDFKVTDTERDQVVASYFFADSYPIFLGDENKDLALDPGNAWKGQTHYRIDATVRVMERVGSVEQVYSYDGDVVQESRSVNFKTGECKLDELVANAKSRLGAFPFPGQRYFLQGESTHGAVILDKNYECAATPSEKYDLLVRFTPVRDHQALPAIEEPVVLNGSRYLTFAIPSLPNACIIRMEVIKRKHLSQSDTYQLFGSNLADVTAINQHMAMSPNWTPNFNASSAPNPALTASAGHGLTVSGNFVTQANFNLTHQLRLTGKNVDIVLYKYHFRTSQFNTLADKVASMYYGTTASYAPLGSPHIGMKAEEPFDSYDVNGFVSDHYIGGKVYFSVPLVTFKETDHGNAWIQNNAQPCVYRMALQAGVNLDNERYAHGITVEQMKHDGIWCNSTANPFCVPQSPISIDSFAPPLSEAEIQNSEPSIWQSVQQDYSSPRLLHFTW